MLVNKQLLTPTLALAVLLVGCGGAADTASEAPAAASEAAQAEGMTVEVVNIAFKPASLKVLRGTEVTWTSADAGVRHTATSGTPGDNGVPGVSEATASKPDGLFDGDLPDAGSDFSFTFSAPGTYAYFCEIHPSMSAEVVVE